MWYGGLSFKDRDLLYTVGESQNDARHKSVVLAALDELERLKAINADQRTEIRRLNIELLRLTELYDERQQLKKLRRLLTLRLKPVRRKAR